MRILQAGALALLAMVQPSAGQDALKPGDEISGKLRFFRHQHSNGTWINVYQIAADRPRPFAAEDEFCDPSKPPRTFHLVANDKAAKARLDRMLGKTIVVKADEFSCSETAWHIGDAVVFQWRFVDPPKR